MAKKQLKVSLAIFIVFATMSCWAADDGKLLTRWNTGDITPDSVVEELYGDTISSLIFSPKTVRLFKIAAGVIPSDNDRTIGGYKVEKSLGKINRNYYPVLQFLLSDNSSYSNEVIVPATPFTPSYAVEFSNKKEKVYLMFSFNSREIAIVKNGIRLKYQQIQNTRLFVLFFQNLVDDQFLREHIKK